MRYVISWIRNTGLIIVSLFLSFFLLEIGLRIIYPDKVIATIRDHSDPLLPRHSTGAHIHPERNTIASFDTNGMRANPNNCPNEPLNLRMLIVGDSNIAGLFLDDTETLGARITEKSRRLGNCISVDTFGVSGFGPDQAVFAIEQITQKVSYDYVVFHIFADNDMGDLIRNNYYRDGRLENNGYCYVDKIYLENFVTYKAIRKLLFLIGLEEFASYGSVVASIGNTKCAIVSQPSGNFFEAIKDRAITDWTVNRNNIRQIYMGDRYDIELACKINKEAILYATEAFKQVRNLMQRLTNNRGFHTLYLVQPSELDVTDNHPEHQDKGCSDYDPVNLTKFYTELLVNEYVVNLYSSFLNCSKCYFTKTEFGNDYHWSPYGISLAAFNVANFVLSHNASQ